MVRMSENQVLIPYPKSLNIHPKIPIRNIIEKYADSTDSSKDRSFNVAPQMDMYVESNESVNTPVSYTYSNLSRSIPTIGEDFEINAESVENSQFRRQEDIKGKAGNSLSNHIDENIENRMVNIRESTEQEILEKKILRSELYLMYLSLDINADSESASEASSLVTEKQVDLIDQNIHLDQDMLNNYMNINNNLIKKSNIYV